MVAVKSPLHSDAPDEASLGGQMGFLAHLDELRTRVIQMMERLMARSLPRNPKDLSGKDLL